MEILNGKDFAQKIKAQVKEKVEKLKKKPTLACVLVEGNASSEIYVASKQRACQECGINSRIVRLKENVTQKKLENEIEKLNKDEDICVILLQLPLPKHLDERHAIDAISPEKDVDCLTNQNLGKLFAGGKFAPCTASGIIKLLEEHDIQIEGKNAVVVGRSLLVGKSVSLLLENKNATVTLCHRKTQNLKKVTKQADILVVAIGNAKFITKDYVKRGAVVIDVGINRGEGKKIFGDVDFENVKSKCSCITPVPGGVGPLTVACLMENTLYLASKAKNKMSKKCTKDRC